MNKIYLPIIIVSILIGTSVVRTPNTLYQSHQSNQSIISLMLASVGLFAYHDHKYNRDQKIKPRQFSFRKKMRFNKDSRSYELIREVHNHKQRFIRIGDLSYKHLK